MHQLWQRTSTTNVCNAMVAFSVFSSGFSPQTRLISLISVYMCVYTFCICMYISVLILTRTKATDDYEILTANDLFLYSFVFNRYAHMHEGTISDGDRSDYYSLFEMSMKFLS